MKKLVLLLMFVTTFCINAQPLGLLNPYIICDNETYDGHATFNLVSSNPIGSLGLDPVVYTVTFHPSVTDANDNINIIANPSAYINEVAYLQTIGVRFLNNTTSEVAVSGMELRLVQVVVPIFNQIQPHCFGETTPPLATTSLNGITGTWSPSTMSEVTTTYTFIPNLGQCAATTTMTSTVYATVSANPATLYFCDTMELAIYNLNDANAQITAGTAGFSITYHETLTDAQIGANPVGPGYSPIATPIQILYARVLNPATGCFTVTTLTLNTHNCPPCSDSAPLNLTANNVTDTSLMLSWETTFGMGTQASLIAIVPYGSPPPNSFSGTISVTTIGNTYTLTNLVSGTCYSIYIKGFCGPTGYSQWSAPLNICMSNCADSGACSQVLFLNAFLDSNNNGVKDTSEIDFNQGNFVYQVNDSGGNQYGTSNDGSYYIFDSNPSNSYDISFAVNAEFSAYYSSTVSHNNVTLPTGSGANYLYFPIANTVPYVDAQVNLWPSGQPRPGFTYSNIIFYQNNGSQTIPNGTLTFTKDPNISISSISETGTNITSTGFTYDFTNLAPFEVRYINVTFLVPTIPMVNLGDLVTNNVTVQIPNDINLSNNSPSITQTIVGSYDPNDKMESHGGKIVHSTFTSNDYLYYTVQFENTGSANAEFVRIEDALDSQLDENTFEMLTASHHVDTKRLGNQLKWHFYNIDLPPTSSNPNGSHGFVSFKVKPKPGYAIGAIIPNTASIFFDYNPAIVTNTFTTEFVLALGNPAFNANTISLYPNPTTDMVTISNSNGNDKIVTVVIYEVSGKRVYTLNKNTVSNINVDVSNFARGLYLVELTSEDNTKITKKLLVK